MSAEIFLMDMISESRFLPSKVRNKFFIHFWSKWSNKPKFIILQTSNFTNRLIRKPIFLHKISKIGTKIANKIDLSLPDF